MRKGKRMESLEATWVKAAMCACEGAASRSLLKEAIEE